MEQHNRLKLRDVRAAFRLIGEIREVGSDPQRWRPRMIEGIRRVIPCDLVISSEVYFRTTSKAGVLRVVDIGWGTDFSAPPWHIHTEREERPEVYLLTPAEKGAAAAAAPAGGVTEPGKIFPVRPEPALRGGSSLILSQYPLPHAGAVDQLGIHRVSIQQPFTPVEHRLLRLFHVELGRLLKQDAMRKAKDPGSELPPRLTQTLDHLLQGLSEKQVAIALGLSRHTVHNYVKALHQRFNVNSRAELITRAKPAGGSFTPSLSLNPPKGSGGGTGESGPPTPMP